MKLGTQVGWYTLPPLYPPSVEVLCTKHLGVSLGLTPSVSGTQKSPFGTMAVHLCYTFVLVQCTRTNSLFGLVHFKVYRGRGTSGRS